MNPGLIVKLRPTGPWRIGPDSGARNRVDAIYHSDSLYSAVAQAMSRLGALDEWLGDTARSATPAVCFSSCFPLVNETLFVTPPRTVWPPSATSLTSGRVRWKSARFVPLNIVRDILSGKTLDENRWTLDGPSGCLMPSGKPGPFRRSVRWSAAIDRLSGAAERHAAACLEFRPGAGLWTVVSFTDAAARDRWQDRVKASFRWLADSGFGGERSRGWGRAEAPGFVEGMLPEMVLPARAPAARAKSEAAAPAPAAIQPDIFPPDLIPPIEEPPQEEPPTTEPPTENPDVNPPIPAPEPELPPPDPDPALAEASAVLEARGPEISFIAPLIAERGEELLSEVPEAAADAEPQAAVNAEPEAAVNAEPEAAVNAEPEAAVNAEPEAAANAEPEAAVNAEPEAAANAEPEAAVNAEPEAAANAEPEAAANAEPEAAANAEPEAAVNAEPEAAANAEPEAAADGAPQAAADAAPQAAANVEAQAAANASPQAAADAAPQAAADVEAQAAANAEAPGTVSSELHGPRSEPQDASSEPEVDARPEPQTAADAEPQVIASSNPQAAGSSDLQAVAITEPQAAAIPEPRLPANAGAKQRAQWLLSLFSPAPADAVEWSRGNYSLIERGGRVESSAGSGALKKQVQMVAEGSVLYAGGALCGAAPDVAPEGFAHPVFRAGFALAIPLPEVS